MSSSRTWVQVLQALRGCSGASVFVRDGKTTEGLASVGTRPGAKGPELCLFTDTEALGRDQAIEELERRSKQPGRLFMTTARARINEAVLLIDAVFDEEVDGALQTIVSTRRPTLGYNQSQQVGATTHLRSKRIKTK